MSNDRPLRIAVLGAGGTMGLPMSRNLARAGMEVRAWNRTAERARPLADEGVTVVEDPAEAARDADVLCTMLADANAVLEAVGADGAPLDALAEGGVWLQMSTIGVEGTARCVEIAKERSVPLVDAPVLGTKKPAEDGALTVLGSGPDDERDRLAPILDAVGQRTLWVGEAGAGTRLKLVVNAWLLSIVEGAAEALALAEGLDLDPALLLDAVGGGPIDMPYLQMKGRAMIDRDFTPSFKLGLAAKDARLAVAAAEEQGLDLAVLAAIRDRFAAGAAAHGDEDMAATFLTSAPASASAR